MMEPAQKYEHVNGEIINLETGEVLPADPLTGELLLAERVVIEDLPKIGRWIRSVDRKLSHIAEAVDGCHCEQCNLRREIDRLEDLAERKSKNLYDQRSAFLAVCENMVRLSGETALKYPGVGKFAWRKGAERVDDSAYRALPAEEAHQLHKEYDDTLFRIKIEPDKTKIKAALKTNPDLGIPFSIERGEDTFEFKAEA